MVHSHRKEPVGAPANALGQPESCDKGVHPTTAREHKGLGKQPHGLLSLVVQPPLWDLAPQSQLSRTVTLRLREGKVKIKLGNRNSAKKPQKSCCRMI